MLDRRGFTLVELLAVITILGILMGVGIASVSWMLDRNREMFYDTAEKNIVTTAQAYFAGHRASLPTVPGQRRKLSLQTLENTGYFKKGDIVDYGKEECYLDESYVYVIKKGDDYQYYLHLKCPAKTIDGDSVLKKATLTNSSSIAGTTLSLKFSSSTTTLAGYQFTLYDASGNIVYNSDGTEIESGKNYNNTIDVSPYAGRVSKAVITVYDEFGNYSTKTDMV